jgi:glycosyltransferase involved in cell wall biosynthesis
MRIAYVAHLNLGRESGVVLKAAAQMERWRAAGHEVRAFVVSRDSDVTWQERLGETTLARYHGPLSRLRAMTRLARSVRRYAPDILYLRYDLFYPSMLLFPRRARLVVEVNTDDTAEYALGSRARAVYNAQTRGIVLRAAAAMVFVTSELAGSPAFAASRGRRVVIPNGIDLGSYPELPPPPEDRPHLVFVGSLRQAWQGTDKLLRLARLRPDWRVDVVGPDQGQAEVPGNVTLHGPLSRLGVIDVLARAHVGVGTLALHRKGMSEACPLKSREYLAVGLPLFYACDDPDVGRVGEHALQLANTEHNIEEELPRIDAFVSRVKGARVPRAAVSHIDVSEKERQRLALFDALTAG